MEKENPKYQQVADWLQGQIQQGSFTAGEQIPPETELAQKFAVSRQTVRHAINLLEQKGLLESRRGSGTFVRQPKIILKKEQGKTIGVISTYLDSYIFPSIIKGIEGVLSAKGYHMQLLLTHNQIEHETRALKALLEAGVDGVIVEPTKSSLPNPNLRYYQEFKEKNIPVVFFNAVYPALDFPVIALDDTSTGRLATEYLIDQGHSRIAGFFLSDNRQGHLRYAGYLEALHTAGIEPRSSDIFWFTTEGIPYLARESSQILEIAQQCTAALCYNDETAWQLMTLFEGQGLGVPREISLIGVDDSDLARLAKVPLTTVAHPSEQVGRTVAEAMRQAVEQQKSIESVLFTPKIIVRDSVINNLKPTQ